MAGAIVPFPKLSGIVQATSIVVKRNEIDLGARQLGVDRDVGSGGRVEVGETACVARGGGAGREPLAPRDSAFSPSVSSRNRIGPIASSSPLGRRDSSTARTD